jgi:hypothetical protein
VSWCPCEPAGQSVTSAENDWHHTRPQHKIGNLLFLLLGGKKNVVTRIIFQMEVKYELKSVKKEEEHHFTNH